MITQDMKSKALETIKKVYEDKEAEINGRKYNFMSMTHKKRLKVFSYTMACQSKLNQNDFSFMATDEFDSMSEIIENHVVFKDMVLSKIPKHWEKFPEDYIKFITTAMMVISYPFLKGNLGD